MTPRTLLVALSLLASCGKSDKRALLRERVEQYCHDLSRELKRAADKYTQLAPALDSGQLSPETDQLSPIESGIDLTPQARSATMLDVHKRFLFCVGVHRIDEKRRDEISDRATVLTQTLGEQFMIAKLAAAKPMSHADAAKQLAELATLAQEVDKLSLLE